MSKSHTNVVHNETTTINKRCTISVDPKVYLRLKDEGKFGESFSELIGRLLDRAAENPPRLLDLLKQRKRLEQEMP
jgi:predicted CopG family antitoxin